MSNIWRWYPFNVTTPRTRVVAPRSRVVAPRSYCVVPRTAVMARAPYTIMARLDRAIARYIALMQVARSSRAMTARGARAMTMYGARAMTDGAARALTKGEMTHQPKRQDTPP